MAARKLSLLIRLALQLSATSTSLITERAVVTRGTTGFSSRATPPSSAIHAFGRRVQNLIEARLKVSSDSTHSEVASEASLRAGKLTKRGGHME
jgi:hypothetical protein